MRIWRDCYALVGYFLGSRAEFTLVLSRQLRRLYYLQGRTLQNFKQVLDFHRAPCLHYSACSVAERSTF